MQKIAQILAGLQGHQFIFKLRIQLQTAHKGLQMLQT